MGELGSHYKSGFSEQIETFRFMKDKMTPEQYKGYLLGCMIKYTSRVNFKESFEEDVKKAVHYGRVLVEFIDEENQRTKATSTFTKRN